MALCRSTRNGLTPFWNASNKTRNPATTVTSPNVVIIHQGTQRYAQIALEQARRAGNDAIMVGFDDASPLADTFEHQYQHMCTNSREFELLCFRRYFVIQKLLRDLNLDGIFHIDSDILLFEDLRAFEAKYLKPDGVACGMHMPASQPHFRCSYGPQTSYWTRGAIDDFCDFLVAAYKNIPALMADKWAWHRQSGASGGICDMSLLYLWAQGQKNIMNFSAALDGAVFDLNINSAENLTPDEYETRLSKKKIIFRDGQPYGRVRKTGKLVRFRALHFQGHIKGQMEHVAQGRSISDWPILKEQAKAYARRLLRRG